MTKIFVALLDNLILNPFSRWLPVVRVDIYLLTHLFIYLHLYSFYIHVFYSFIFIHLKNRLKTVISTTHATLSFNMTRANIKLSPFRLFRCLIGETSTFIWQHEFHRFIFQSTVDGCQMANELSTITRLYTPPYNSPYDSFLYSKFHF